MMKIKRYEMVTKEKSKSCEMTEWIFGDYVKYADVVEYVKAVREECAKVADDEAEGFCKTSIGHDLCMEIADNIRALNKD